DGAASAGAVVAFAVVVAFAGAGATFAGAVVAGAAVAAVVAVVVSAPAGGTGSWARPGAAKAAIRATTTMIWVMSVGRILRHRCVGDPCLAGEVVTMASGRAGSAARGALSPRPGPS